MPCDHHAVQLNASAVGLRCWALGKYGRGGCVRYIMAMLCRSVQPASEVWGRGKRRERMRGEEGVHMHVDCFTCLSQWKQWRFSGLNGTREAPSALRDYVSHGGCLRSQTPCDRKTYPIRHEGLCPPHPFPIEHGGGVGRRGGVPTRSCRYCLFATAFSGA